MTIPVKKIGEISLAIFESIFATKICNFQDNKAIIAYFNEFDESILSLIHEKINDEYELEKVDDYILKNPLFNERKYQFITEDEKINFIDEFYKKNTMFLILKRSCPCGAIHYFNLFGSDQF